MSNGETVTALNENPSLVMDFLDFHWIMLVFRGSCRTDSRCKL